jgi:hypothetical protein
MKKFALDDSEVAIRMKKSDFGTPEWPLDGFVEKVSAHISETAVVC